MANETNELDLENVTLPQNDVERWILASYAMWSEYYSEGNWQYIAGSPVKEENASNMQLMLSRDWGIDDREDLLNTLMSLIALYEDEETVDMEDLETGAWDLCRACQILGMAFVGGIICRQEMIDLSLIVCSLMQFYYPSWLHLYHSYLKGYKAWRLGEEDDEDDDDYEDYDADDEDYEDDEEDDEDYEDDDEDDDYEDDDEALEAVAEREQIIRQLLIMPNGPCSIPWNLELPIEFEDDEEEEE